MSRSRIAAMALVAIIAVSGTLGYFIFFNQTPEIPPPPVPVIEPHPYNNLNWWDIAWDLGEFTELLTPMGEVVARGNRHNENPNSGYTSAADYLINRLEEWGIPTQYVEPHMAVLGHQEGYGSDNRAIVFGAHLDSDQTGTGVRQNAGGVGVVTLIAKILSQFRLPIDVYYCYFSYNTVFIDEQQVNRAMWGSKEIAALLKTNNVDVIAFYNFDEVLFVDPLQPMDERLIVEHDIVSTLGYHKTRYLADLLITAMQTAGLNVISADENSLTQTDHWAFWDEGYPAVNVQSGHSIDPEFTPPDTMSSSSYDLEQASYLARAAAAVAVYLAQQGNGEDASYKVQRVFEPGETITIRPVVTVSQILTINGTKSMNGSLELRITGGGQDILEATLVSDTNFTITSDEFASVGPIAMTIRNTHSDTMDVELYLEYESDIDGNGATDAEQYSWSEPDPPLDWDQDGLSDEDETDAGTDIFVGDTDMDSVADGTEVFYGMDPLRDDTLEDIDEDGLNNIREIQLGTHPGLNDTDADAMDDLWEVVFLTDPLVDDADLDLDNDNLTNLEEYIYGADPRSSDGDYDGVPDADEVALGMNALSDDTDSDGLRDQLELIEGLDPLTPDYDLDLNPDGPDHNPKINTILVIILITVVPVTIGSIIFRRRLYK